MLFQRKKKKNQNKKEPRNKEILKTIKELREESKEEIKGESTEKPLEEFTEDEQIAHLYSEVYQGELSIAEFTRVLKSDHNISYTARGIRNKLIRQGVYQSKEEKKETGKFRSRRYYKLFYNDLICKGLKEKDREGIRNPEDIWWLDDDELDELGEATDLFLYKYLPGIKFYEDRKEIFDLILVALLPFMVRIVDTVKWKKSRK